MYHTYDVVNPNIEINLILRSHQAVRFLVAFGWLDPVKANSFRDSTTAL